MSRVAKADIKIPANVELNIADGLLTVKGPKGQLTQAINSLVSVEKCKETNTLSFKPVSGNPDDTQGWAQSGTARALVFNMVTGVTEGFTRGLELVGVGYRAQAAGQNLNLSLGYSHGIVCPIPEGVTAETPTNTSIILKGVDKQQLGALAAQIRAYRPPEPYKGKGVKYVGERIARKEAKKK